MLMVRTALEYAGRHTQFKTPGRTCPHCRAKLEFATSVNHHEDPRKPKPEDISICSQCGGLMQMGLTGWERLSDEALVELQPETREALRNAQKAIARHHNSTSNRRGI